MYILAISTEDSNVKEKLMAAARASRLMAERDAQAAEQARKNEALDSDAATRSLFLAVIFSRARFLSCSTSLLSLFMYVHVML